MVSDKLIETNYRKHRRSSSPSNEADKPSKRRKHRHRHHRDKKHDDEVQDGNYETVRDNVSPLLKDAGGNNGGEIDLEEGKVLEEEGIGEILKKKLESDGELRDIKSGQFRENNLPLYIDTHPDDGLADDRDFGELVHQPKEETFRCCLTRESERGDGYPSEKIVKESYENGRRSFPSENSEDKHEIRTRSPSITRHTGDIRAQNRSRSCDRKRERSRSRSAMENEPTVRGRHCGSSRERDTDREGIIKAKEEEGSKHRDRGLWREREWEKRKEIEADLGKRKDGGSIDRDRRRERKRDYLRDKDHDRGRSGDKARYSSRERGREYEMERRSEKDSNKGREIPSDLEKHKSCDDGYGEARHKQCGHSRNDEEDDLEIRSSNSIKGHNPKGGNSKENGGNVERSRNDDDQNDNGEEVVWELAEQEYEESKIIEESRRRTQAIVEKYKKKSEQQNGFSSHDTGRDLELEAIPKQSSNVADVHGSGTLGPAASAVDQAKGAIDGDAANLSSTVGESPARLVISDSDRTVAPVGLGEGSPKGERSDDMFSDDIFGESPAGTRKTGGKGNGLAIVRSGLHDNWDDAEGIKLVQILKKLCGSDPEDKCHCVRFLSSFKYRNHLCLVFESLHLNLGEVLKKFSRNIGLNILGVRTYAKQLFTSLKHLKNCGVLHCDRKPDNMLCNVCW